MTAYTASIGTVSHGTLRAVDLLESFADELECLDHDDDFTGLVREARACLDRLNDADDTDDDDTDDDDAAELVNDLIDALDSFSPPFCRFGAHEGDASDFGFWPCEDSIDRAVQEGSVMKTESGLDDETFMAALREHVERHRALPDYAVSVTDHGNVTVSTLVDVTLQEVWSCV